MFFESKCATYPFNVPKEYYELYENEIDLLESQKDFME